MFKVFNSKTFRGVALVPFFFFLNEVFSLHFLRKYIHVCIYEVQPQQQKIL
jgi:hypothetical protein